MEGKKAALVLLLALVAMGSFAIRCSARSTADFGRLVQGGFKWPAYGKCERCYCEFPSQVNCQCGDESSECNPGCKNCPPCYKSASGELRCSCNDPITPDQCIGVYPYSDPDYPDYPAASVLKMTAQD